jgi:hypothetical protein
LKTINPPTRLIWVVILLVLSSIVGLAQSPGEHAGNKETTKMDSYTGKIEPMGMSIFMQGSHQLLDESGAMIVILQSDGKVDLNKFVGKKVKVSGTTEDTVEGGGKLLTVSSAESL